jgi:hypothetical protein
MTFQELLRQAGGLDGLIGGGSGPSYGYSAHTQMPSPSMPGILPDNWQPYGQATPATPAPLKQYTPPQPAFTPISQGLQGQFQPFQMPPPPQNWQSTPRTMPQMQQQPMPNIAQMLAQMGGQFPLMNPATFMQDAQRQMPNIGGTPTPSPQPAERQTNPYASDPTQDPNWAEDTNSGANPERYGMPGTVGSTTPQPSTAPLYPSGVIPNTRTQSKYPSLPNYAPYIED